tara:strand:- start:3946 stop:4446 length:501 start_codon:yes stop_codon:yes gene_type:complete
MRNSYIFFLLVLYTSLINASGFWSVVPIVIVDSLKNPIKCGYRYESPSEEIVLKLEKYVVNHHVITSFSVKNPNIKKTDLIRLQTKSFDTKKNFKNHKHKKNEYIATANLEKSNEGGKLFYELAIFGGMLKINDIEYKLPLKLPREISALYLNCAGDLIRPENEIH